MLSIARSRLLATAPTVSRVRWASQVPPKRPTSSDQPTPETRDSGSASSSPDAEPLASGSAAGKAPSLDFMPSAGEEPQRTGARSSKGTMSGAEKRRQVMSRVMLAIVGGGIVAHTVYLGREWEPEELVNKRLRLEDAPASRWARTAERFSDLFDYFNKPAWPELLPPPYPPPHGKPYTLVLSMDDLLITSMWDRQHGWRTAKRPGLDYFLAYISQFYEVVIFTTQPSYTAAPIIEKLDRYNFFVTHRLFREGTRSINGEIVKDLSYLNRDPSKVIVVDTVPDHVRLQPENAIVLPKWKGDPNDTGLVAIIPFLESIGIYKPPDVRPILQKYEGKDLAIEYAKKEAEAKVRQVEEWKAKHKGVTPGFMSSLLGISSSSGAVATPRGQPPPTYLEQKRREAQQQYQDEQKYIRDNREQLEKLLEADLQAQQAAIPNNLWEAIDQFSGKPKAPPANGAASTSSTTPSTPSSTPAA